MKYEQLAVKFKSGDVAEKFKDIFEKCQKDIREKPTGYYVIIHPFQKDYRGDNTMYSFLVNDRSLCGKY